MGVDYDSSIDDSNKIRSSTGILLIDVAYWTSELFSQNLSNSTDETQSFSFNLSATF